MRNAEHKHILLPVYKNPSTGHLIMGLNSPAIQNIIYKLFAKLAEWLFKVFIWILLNETMDQAEQSEWITSSS